MANNTLDKDLNIIAKSGLPALLLPFSKEMGIISALDDEPNDVGGLTAAELKAKFDEAGVSIQKYINETLIPAVLAEDATEADRAEAERSRRSAETGRVNAEFSRTQAEEARVNAEAKRQDAATHTPYVGENGNLFIWDFNSGTYQDTGAKVEGDIGPKGDPGQDGQDGKDGKDGRDGADGKDGAPGPQGPPGKDGADGRDGVLIDLAPGMFAMGLSEDGHLLVAVNEGDAAPPLSIDPATGHLIYNITTND